MLEGAPHTSTPEQVRTTVASVLTGITLLRQVFRRGYADFYMNGQTRPLRRATLSPLRSRRRNRRRPTCCGFARLRQGYFDVETYVDLVHDLTEKREKANCIDARRHRLEASPCQQWIKRRSLAEANTNCLRPADLCDPMTMRAAVHPVHVLQEQQDKWMQLWGDVAEGDAAQTQQLL